jgi:alkylation response protein AidB-like acyl-CoA dehydrogenase
MRIEASTAADEIRQWWSARAPNESPEAASHISAARAAVAAFVADGLADLPQPGDGNTADRFECLATIGELDLTFARLIEAHTDALAILAEFGEVSVGRSHGEVWAVWAAEPPSPRVSAALDHTGRWLLSGRKPWCSGARTASAALITATSADGPRLFAVDLQQTGVKPVGDLWAAAALAGTDTQSVDFSEVVAIPLGGPEEYVIRPGFWYGAVGVAAVWYGGACAVADQLQATARRRDLGDLGAAHLGRITASLTGAVAVLRDSARMIDSGAAAKAPYGEIHARAARAVVEDCATMVIDEVGRALGPAPLAMNGAHARRVADLQLYLRQSHADRDLAELGRRIVEAGGEL